MFLFVEVLGNQSRILNTEDNILSPSTDHQTIFLWIPYDMTSRRIIVSYAGAEMLRKPQAFEKEKVNIKYHHVRLAIS